MREHELGPCCICGTYLHVRTLMCLDALCPIPGRGWGCFQCGLPEDGAMAVLCDHCANDDEAREKLVYACNGYPGSDGRVPISHLTGEHRHDLSSHPEIRQGPNEMCYSGEM